MLFLFPACFMVKQAVESKQTQSKSNIMNAQIESKAVKNETQAEIAKQAKAAKQAAAKAKRESKAAEKKKSPAIDWKAKHEEIHRAAIDVNGEKHRAASVSSLNTCPLHGFFGEIVKRITESVNEQHALDVVNGTILYLKTEAKLVFLKKMVKDKGASTVIDKKATLIESPRKLAHDCMIAHQKAIIAEREAYKATILYVRPASK